MHRIVAAQLREQRPPAVVLIQPGIADIDRSEQPLRLGHRFAPAVAAFGHSVPVTIRADGAVRQRLLAFAIQQAWRAWMRGLSAAARPDSFGQNPASGANVTASPPSHTPALDFDVIVIGAGLSGMYQLYRLRELGLRVRVFESGSEVGGTWYWNRYPGARFDSESYSYGFSFSKELLDEWEWSEHFASQPETLRYLNLVADKFALRRDIRFRSRVAAAHYQDKTASWELTLEDGARFRSRFLITAIGPLSAPTMPRI